MDLSFTGAYKAARDILQSQHFARHIDPLVKEIASLPDAVELLRGHFRSLSETLRGGVIFSDHPPTRYLRGSGPEQIAALLEDRAAILGKLGNVPVIYPLDISRIQPSEGSANRVLISDFLHEFMHLNPQVGDFRYGWLAPGSEFPSDTAIRNAESLMNFTLDLLGELPETESRIALYRGASGSPTSGSGGETQLRNKGSSGLGSPEPSAWASRKPAYGLDRTFTSEYQAARKILESENFALYIGGFLKEIARLMKDPNPGQALGGKLNALRSMFTNWEAHLMGGDEEVSQRWAQGQLNRYFDPNYMRDPSSPDAIIEACWHDADYGFGSRLQDNTGLARKAAAIKFLLDLRRYEGG